RVWCRASLARACRHGAAESFAVDAAARPKDAVLADIGERYRTQIEVDLIAELFPQIMSETSGAIAAAADRRAGSATDRAYRPFSRHKNITTTPIAAVW